jgi:hypothetical protein
VLLARRGEHDDGCRPVGESAGQRLQAELAQLRHRERQDARRQAPPSAGAPVHEIVAVPGLVEQEYRFGAARVEVAAQQRA